MNKKKQVFSKPFNLVYENNYPNLLVGPGFFNIYDYAKMDSPESWIKQPISKIEENRSKQFFSFKSFKKTDAIKDNKVLFNIQLLSQSNNTSELEVNITSKVNKIKENVSGINNLSYNLNDFKIIDNVKIPKIIDKTVNDKDLLSKEGILEIHNNTNDVYKIEQIISLGLLGKHRNRVLVPTRWSITLVDDVVGKDIIDNFLLYYSTIDSFLVFSFEFYMNKFYILFIPRGWAYEQLEFTKSVVMKDYEIGSSKKEYANNVCGGYYAARLEIAKYLKNIKKQASVIVFRDISSNYDSKGVWVVREAVKEALTKQPFSFDSFENAVSFLKTLTNNKIDEWLKQSHLNFYIKTQKTLFDF